MTTCDNLIAFVDGELSPVEADAFRAHLISCEKCEKRLVEAVQLSAQPLTLRVK